MAPKAVNETAGCGGDLGRPFQDDSGGSPLQQDFVVDLSPPRALGQNPGFCYSEELRVNLSPEGKRPLRRFTLKGHPNRCEQRVSLSIARMTGRCGLSDTGTSGVPTRDNATGDRRSPCNQRGKGCPVNDLRMMGGLTGALAIRSLGAAPTMPS